MTTVYDKAHVYDLMLGESLTPYDPRVPVLLAATKASPVDHDILLDVILNKRRIYRKRVTVLQRHWQSKVSRRPQRGNHHDSWTIRERYVRC